MLRQLAHQLVVVQTETRVYLSPQGNVLWGTRHVEYILQCISFNNFSFNKKLVIFFLINGIIRFSQGLMKIQFNDEYDLMIDNVDLVFCSSLSLSFKSLILKLLLLVVSLVGTIELMW